MRTLTVNNELLTDGITLLSIEYGYATVTNYEDWLKNSLNPHFYGQDIQYTTAKIELLIEASDLGALEAKCSDVYEKFRKAVIKDSLTKFSIDGHLKNCDENRLGPKARALTISFEGVKTGDRDMVTHTFVMGQSWKPEIQGNIEVPAVFTIYPDMGYVMMTIKINDESYILSNIDRNVEKIVIDSEKGTITADGINYVDHYDSWSLPKIKGGNTTISVTGGTPYMTIEYNGRWI